MNAAEMTVARYRHVKRGSTYEIVGWAELQASGGPIVEGTRLTIYRSEATGALWARPDIEFDDGRFERLPGAAIPVEPDHRDAGLAARVIRAARHAIINQYAGGSGTGMRYADIIEQAIRAALAAIPIEADHRDEQILALAAAKRDLEAHVAMLREATKHGLQFAVLMLAFIGRDQGTSRFDETIKQLCEIARLRDNEFRDALAATEPKEDPKERTDP